MNRLSLSPLGARAKRARDKTPMDLNHLSSDIIKAAINVHKELGPGLLESVYQICLAMELQTMGKKVQTEFPVPIYYQNQIVQQEGFRLDLLVEETIVVELKSVAQIQDVHKKQLLTYLRLAKKPLGLLINFNEVLIKDGITRIANSPVNEESFNGRMPEGVYGCRPSQRQP